MTRDEIMALSGRELDAAVAEQVMGTSVQRGPVHKGFYDDIMEPIPHYSTDIAAAWLVVVRVSRPGEFRLSHGASGYWWASLGGPAAQGETAAEAICRMALMVASEEVSGE